MNVHEEQPSISESDCDAPGCGNNVNCSNNTVIGFASLERQLGALEAEMHTLKAEMHTIKPLVASLAYGQCSNSAGDVLLVAAYFGTKQQGTGADPEHAVFIKLHNKSIVDLLTPGAIHLFKY
jgi:hypothetical protein